jgi:hypothetical protein
LRDELNDEAAGDFGGTATFFIAASAAASEGMAQWNRWQHTAQR